MQCRDTVVVLVVSDRNEVDQCDHCIRAKLLAAPISSDKPCEPRSDITAAPNAMHDEIEDRQQMK
jgi:hypothetical protein